MSQTEIGISRKYPDSPNLFRIMTFGDYRVGFRCCIIYSALHKWNEKLTKYWDMIYEQDGLRINSGRLEKRTESM